MAMHMRAVVVGAGIAGLASAIALQQRGWDVTVLERAPAVRVAGLALSLAPNATKALDELGLIEDVLAVAVRVVGGEALDRHGRTLKRVEFAAEHATARHPMVFVLRPRLHEVLLRAYGRPVRVGAHVIAAATDRAEVTLEGGEKVAGDLVVGADGLRSAVRTSVLGPEEPRPVGVDAFRGLVRDDGSIPTGFAQLLFGRGVEAGAAACGEGLVYWYISAPAGRFATVEDAASSLPAAVQARIRQTAPADVRRDTIYDWPPASRWHRGRTVLVGDAVHAMAPHAGQGAAQALLDAVALAEALGTGERIEEGLEMFERWRKPLASKAVRASRRNARVSLIENPILLGLRDVVLRLLPPSMMARAFGGVDAPTR